MVFKKFTELSLPAVGSWLQVGDPDLSLVMGKSGFDFLVVDMEHGSISEDRFIGILNNLRNTDCVPFARVAKNDNILIRRALDLGAKGIIVPNVKSPQDVINAEKAIFYPPRGQRGIGFSKSNDYGLEFEKNFKNSNDEIILIIQIEHIDSLKKIDEIFAKDSIYAYMIGPYDLTGSMGILGQFNNPDYLNVLSEIKLAAKRNNVIQGIHVVSPKIDDLKFKIDEGYNFIAYGTDALLLNKICSSEIKEINN